MRNRRRSSTTWSRSSKAALRIRLSLAATGQALAAAGLLAISPPWVGLSAHGSQLWSEVPEAIEGPAAGDRFAHAVAAGDFDGNGSDDLVTGIPGEDCVVAGEIVLDCGSLIVRTSGVGLGLGSGFTRLDPTFDGSPLAPQASHQYGKALATGDFDGDGHDDLAIGVPQAGSVGSPGAVIVHYGVIGGIDPFFPHLLRQGVSEVSGAAATSFLFGDALAVGDFNGDGADDLAIGSPRDKVANATRAGAVIVAHGGATGLLPFDGFEITQDEAGIPDVAETNEEFGSAVAAGDWNGDGFDDLAIGVPYEDGCGAVLVLFGSPNSLIFANSYYLGEVDLGGACELEDQMGRTLAAGDFDADGFDDLVYGLPGEDGNSGEIDMGMFGVLPGAPGSPAGGGGFNFAGRQWWWDDQIPGEESTGKERLASAFAVGDFDGDGFDDLAVGAPGESAFVFFDDGAVRILTGGPALLSTRHREFSLFSPGIPDTPDQTQTFFGSALAAGDFDGNGNADLAVGMPDVNIELSNDGAALVLYGHLFRDGFEGGDVAAWSSVVP